MTHEEWQKEFRDATTKLRDLKRIVNKSFFVPSVMGQPIWADIRVFLCEEAKSFKVGDVMVGAFWINEDRQITAEFMDEFVLTAYLKVKKAVDAWHWGAPNDFPTADELELIDGDTFQRMLR